MIDQYIYELLKENQRVIVPDLGSFMLGKDREDNSYEITFNDFLRFNDGVLIELVARREKINKSEASSQVKAYVAAIHEQVNAGERVYLEGMGHVFRDPNGKLAFATEFLHSDTGAAEKTAAKDESTSLSSESKVIPASPEPDPNESKTSESANEAEIETQHELAGSTSDSPESAAPKADEPFNSSKEESQPAEESKGSKMMGTPPPAASEGYQPKSTASSPSYQAESDQRPPVIPVNRSKDRNWIPAIFLSLFLVVVLLGASYFFYPDWFFSPNPPTTDYQVPIVPEKGGKGKSAETSRASKAEGNEAVLNSLPQEQSVDDQLDEGKEGLLSGTTEPAGTDQLVDEKESSESTPPTEPIDQASRSKSESMAANANSDDKPREQQAIEEPKTEVEPDEIFDPVDFTQQYPYHVIAASYPSEQEALAGVMKLRKQGFSSNLVNQKNGYFRVSFNSFETKAEALVYLEEIRQQPFAKNAWYLYYRGKP